MDNVVLNFMKIFEDLFLDILSILHSLLELTKCNPTATVAFLGICISFVAAYWGVRTNRDIAKKKATLDLILGEQTNEYIQKSREVFMALRKKNEKLDSYLNEPNKIPSEDVPHREEITPKKAIQASINRYEMIAIGIKEGIVCEETYRCWLQTTVVNDWKAVENFVADIRKKSGNENLYEYFERMAIRFNPKAIQPKKTWYQKIGLGKQH